MSPERHPSRAAAAQFALRFRLLMSYHNLTLQDIAKTTHSAVSTVGTWKNGRVPSSEKTLAELAKVFHVDVEYLLTGLYEAKKGPAMEKLATYVLEDLERLHRALEEDRPVALPLNDEVAYGRPGGTVQRREVEDYLRTYLDRAEREPGGLAHAWVQLRKEFPLDLYDRLRR